MFFFFFFQIIVSLEDRHWQGNWFWTFPESQKGKVQSNSPLHCFSRMVIPVGNLDDSMFYHFLSAHSPFSGTELDSNQSLDIQRFPKFLGSVVRQRIILILLDEETKLDHIQEHADELGTDMDALTPFDNLSIFGEVLAFATNETIGELFPDPLIIFAHVDRTVCTFAGVEGTGNEFEDAPDSGFSLREVLIPLA